MQKSLPSNDKIYLVKLFKSRKFRLLAKIFLITVIFGLGIFADRIYPKISASWKVKKNVSSFSKTPEKHVAFLGEIYDLIKQNYWDKISDEQLVNLYVLAAEKVTGKKQEIKTKDLKNLQQLLLKNINEIKDKGKKKEFTTTLADIVLANLQPFGRSRLYSQKQEVDLKNTVENKTEVDHYKTLDVSKEVSPDQLKKAFEKKVVELKKDQSPEAKEKLTEVNKAYQILSDEGNKKTYDELGVEPTMENRLIGPSVFYIRLNKFSPTTIEELVRVTQKVDKDPGPTALIVDLRDNVGGAIDGLPYFLGPFIGNDQYTYQFYHQGQKEDFKTKIGWLPSLVRYKNVVILVNENTQSSAEVMAAVLKKYNVGIVVGTKTRGWGTVEKVFEIKNQFDSTEKYSAFLAHHLTLREDGQPIEGKGVEPLVNIQDPNWQKQLNTYFHYPELTNAVAKLINPK